MIMLYLLQGWYLSPRKGVGAKRSFADMLCRPIPDTCTFMFMLFPSSLGRRRATSPVVDVKKLERCPTAETT